MRQYNRKKYLVFLLTALLLISNMSGISTVALMAEPKSDSNEAYDPMLSESSRKYQWYHRAIGHSFEDKGGSGVKVAVIDTGVNATHEDLSGRVVKTISLISETEDRECHGSIQSGIIAATYGNGKGGAGIAPEAGIVSIKTSHSLSDLVNLSDDLLIKAIDVAMDEDVKVINISQHAKAGSGYVQRVQDKINDAAEKGILIVAAAGNDGVSVRRYPAAYDNVMGIASYGMNGELYSSSNYGDWVDVAAPGENIYSTLDVDDEGSHYSGWTGTSEATSVVSGVAAVLYSSYPDLTAYDIREAIIEGAKKGGREVAHGLYGVDLAASLEYLSDKYPVEEVSADNVVSEDAVSRDAVSKDAVSKDAVSKDAVSKDSVSNDGAEDDQRSDDTVFDNDQENNGNKDEVDNGNVSANEISGNSVPDDDEVDQESPSSVQTISDDSTDQGAASNNSNASLSENTVSEDNAVPEIKVPDSVLNDQNITEEPGSDGIVEGHDVSGNAAVSENDAVSEDSISENGTTEGVSSDKTPEPVASDDGISDDTQGTGVDGEDNNGDGNTSQSPKVTITQITDSVIRWVRKTLEDLIQGLLDWMFGGSSRRAEVDEGNVSLILNSRVISSSDVPNEAQSIAAALPDTVSEEQIEFLDLSLYAKNDSTGREEALHELSGYVEITVDIPERFLNAVLRPGFERIYYVARYHDGEAVSLDGVRKTGSKLSVSTDRFSTYAVAYEDKPISDSAAVPVGVATTPDDNTGNNAIGTSDIQTSEATATTTVVTTTATAAAVTPADSNANSDATDTDVRSDSTSESNTSDSSNSSDNRSTNSSDSRSSDSGSSENSGSAIWTSSIMNDISAGSAVAESNSMSIPQLDCTDEAFIKVDEFVMGDNTKAKTDLTNETVSDTDRYDDPMGIGVLAARAGCGELIITTAGGQRLAEITSVTGGAIYDASDKGDANTSVSRALVILLLGLATIGSVGAIIIILQIRTHMQGHFIDLHSYHVERKTLKK